ncbi:hypothetical protein MRS44_003874 [Fusarium solani]|uniref:uncharacterized protein n=1 Tax=Fusarium solani TaxID=169388 RepID=UPI0032C453D2|nr:hypothetical protein MRS44_003874 [Fusarium solani]
MVKVVAEDIEALLRRGVLDKNDINYKGDGYYDMKLGLTQITKFALDTKATLVISCTITAATVYYFAYT